MRVLGHLLCDDLRHRLDPAIGGEGKRQDAAQQRELGIERLREPEPDQHADHRQALPRHATIGVHDSVRHRSSGAASPSSCQMNVQVSVSSSSTFASGFPAPWPARASSRSSTGSAATTVACLQPGRHLARVQRIDARVALGGGDQDRRVGGPVTHMVVGRIRREPPELLGIIGRAVLRYPQPGDQESMIAQHVEQRHLNHHGAEQVRPLRQDGAHEQAAVRAALRREMRADWSSPSG